MQALAVQDGVAFAFGKETNMMIKTIGFLTSALILGAILVFPSTMVASAKGQSFVVILLKPASKKPVAAMKVGPDGSFSFKELEPGQYRICLENMTGCV